MHELSIALSLIRTATAEAARLHASAVRGVHLRWGPLSGVVKEALLGAYEAARAGSPLERASLVIDEAPLLMSCPACGSERPVKSLQEMCCEICGTPAEQLVSGRELVIVALEIEQ